MGAHGPGDAAAAANELPVDPIGLLPVDPLLNSTMKKEKGVKKEIETLSGFLMLNDQREGFFRSGLS